MLARTPLLFSGTTLFRHSVAWTQVCYKHKRAKNAAKVRAVPVEDADIDLQKYDDSMRNTFEGLSNTYTHIRSGMPTPSLLDVLLSPKASNSRETNMFVKDIAVEAYGSRTTLKSLAQVSVKDGRTLFITTYDDNVAGAVEKAVRSAGLNLNPINEGNGRLRVPVVKPSKESRSVIKELVMKEGEAAKVAARIVRRKAMEDIKRLKDQIGSEDVKRYENSVQKMTDLWIDRIAQAQKSKADAVMDPKLSPRK